MADKTCAPKGKWMIAWGTHDGTHTGRDLCPRITASSKKEAREVLEAAIRGLLPGMYFWFANMYDDQGNMTVITF